MYVMMSLDNPPDSAHEVTEDYDSDDVFEKEEEQGKKCCCTKMIFPMSDYLDFEMYILDLILLPVPIEFNYHICISIFVL